MREKENRLEEKIKKLSEAQVIQEVIKATPFNDEPRFPAYACAPYDTDMDIYYGGSLSLKPEAAKMKAVSECVERFCLRHYDGNGARVDSFVGLSKNKKALDPTTCISSDSDKNDIINIRNSKISWTKGYDFFDNMKEVYIPSQLIYVPYYSIQEPKIRPQSSTGAAAGYTYTGAVLRGALELIERDSTLISYLTKRDVHRVNLDTPILKKIEKKFNEHSLELYVFDVTTDLVVPSMIALIIDKNGKGPAICAGQKANLNPQEAVLGAILEAHQARLWLKVALIYNLIKKIDKPRDIISLKTRGYYWFPKERIKDLSFLLDQKQNINLSKIPNLERHCEEDNLSYIYDILKGKKYNFFVVDVSLNKIKKAGYVVVKTIVPQLYPFYVEEPLKFFKNERLDSFCKEYLNPIPHPFM